ncbi:FAD:protein FMN transferase [Arcticibacter sp. MXS-1]|uniref:FAD:protein FMN transferase n=1 Tax=Arcticibacter sp. MXS-1 TaxID=3341726 RepID=UPI0035A8C36A
MKVLALALIGLGSLLTALHPPSLKRVALSGYAQGTTYHVTYYSPDSMVTSKELEGLLASLDSSLSIYKSYSLISRFNNAPRGVRVDEHLRAVVVRSLQITKETSGIFDITIQPLVQAWGFGVKNADALPDSSRVRELMHCTGSSGLTLKGDSLVKKMPCLTIDVNGIAQGYSVDVLCHYLEAKGIVNYLVEIGGEVRVKGQKQPEGKPLTIGIEGPADDWNAEPLQKIVELREGAITTSGNYRKYYQQGKHRISHLIDARTGFPIENELISATVWAKDAITADGLDNAMMALGLTEALAFARKRHDMELYLIYRKSDGTVADTASAGFYKMIRQVPASDPQ